MKIFTEKKGIARKIIITIIFVILCNFIVPNISLALDGDEVTAEVFGVLFTPIKELLLGITDAVIWGIQYVICGIDETFVDANWTTQIEREGVNLSGNVNDIPRNLSQEIQRQKATSKGIIPTNLRLPMFLIAPDEIFANKLPLLDVNFFSATDNTEVQTTLNNGQTVTMTSSAATLKPVISKWYYALRNFAIVALLSVLVYIGIRIIISSSTENRAKYKQRLMDWLVAMCLIFFMHYIMSFAVTLTEEITKAVSSMNEPYKAIIREEEGDTRKLQDYVIEGEPVGTDYIEWPTNLMGKARIDLQLISKDYNAEQKLMRAMGFTIIYMGLVIYTVLFLFRYLRRLMMLAFLTMFAPLMAMTYPLDKMRDGKAQGFNIWLKEYIFNLLIQPVHLILYTVLIGTAIDFAGDNILYSLVAFGFILQAEKIMKKLFGFNKATTVSNTSAALGGALTMKGVEMLSKHLSGGKKTRSESSSNAGNASTPQLTRKPTRNINDLVNDVLQVPGSAQESESDSEDDSGINVNDTTSDLNPEDIDTSINLQELNNIGENQPRNEEEILKNNGLDNIVNNQMRNNGNTDVNGQGKNNSYNSRNSIVSGNNSSISDNANSNTNAYAIEEDDDGSQAEAQAQAILAELANRQNDPTFPTTNNKKTLTKGQRFKKHASYIGPKLAKGIGKGLAKGVVGVGLAGIGATVGISAGLVSDDFSNVVKYGLAGAGATLLAGKGIANKVEDFKETITQEYEKEYNATHSKEEIAERQDEKALKDPKRINKYQEEFGVTKEEAIRIVREEVRQYREYGITDDDIIIKSMKTKDFGESATPKQRTSKERILLARMASQVGGKEDRYQRLKEGLKDRGIKNKDATKYLRTIRTFNHWV